MPRAPLGSHVLILFVNVLGVIMYTHVLRVEVALNAT